MHAVQTWWCSKDTCHAVFSCDTKFLCHALQDWIVIFHRYRPVCISTAALCYLFHLFWTPVLYSVLQRVSPVCEYMYSCGAAISSGILLLSVFNCGLIWVGRTTEGTEQGRNYADHPKKMGNKKNSGSQNHWSACIKGREREKSHRASRDVLKPRLARVPHTSEVVWPSWRMLCFQKFMQKVFDWNRAGMFWDIAVCTLHYSTLPWHHTN